MNRQCNLTLLPFSLLICWKILEITVNSGNYLDIDLDTLFLLPVLSKIKKLKATLHHFLKKVQDKHIIIFYNLIPDWSSACYKNI